MGIFQHEVGNNHFKLPAVNVDWVGLQRKTFYHERQCWPMFGVLAFSMGIMSLYAIRLTFQKDQITNRSKQVANNGDVKQKIQLFNNNFRNWEKINPQLRKPNLDDYHVPR